MPSTLAFKKIKISWILHPLKIKQINPQFTGLSRKRECRRVCSLPTIYLPEQWDKVVRKGKPCFWPSLSCHPFPCPPVLGRAASPPYGVQNLWSKTSEW